MKFFSSCSLNLQDLAASEALSLGLKDVKQVMGGIEFEADFWSAVYYCLSTRLSSRVMMRIYEKIGVKNVDDLHKASEEIPLEDYFNADNTFFVSSTIHSCPWLKSSMLLSQVIKDGICDRQRKIFGKRSYIDKDSPYFVIHIHIDKDKAQWYIDFSSQSLCKRHYRVKNTEVYLQEHTSSSVLLRSGFMKDGDIKPIVDPFCGSGTILIEAALMATNTAPGLISTERYAFLRFKEFERAKYDKIISELKEKSEIGKRDLKSRFSYPFLLGFDSDSNMIDAAKQNAKAAGVSEFIDFKVKKIENLKNIDLPSQILDKPGFIITDPPYSKRVIVENVESIYKEFGDKVQEYFQGWNASVLTSDSEFLKYINLKPQRTNTMMNGSIKCTLAHYYILTSQEREKIEEAKRIKIEELLSLPLSSGAKMIYNRFEKNKKSLEKFLKENDITCYRIYDADMNEYSAAVDIYENKFAVVQEYEKGKNVSESDAAKRLGELKLALIKSLNIAPENIFTKTRQRTKGKVQYNKLSSENQNYIVKEGGLRFLVNFTDYLDTGLFLDHRNIRNYIRQISNGKRFLNLFCYTGSASVYALSGGALSCTNIDASSKYLDIAKENIKINFLPSSKCFYHKCDCFEYLKSLHDSDVFDLIFLDPPTFSNSKDLRVFDVQRDHSAIIKLCLSHLSKDGELIFSTNFRDFKFDRNIESIASVQDISEKTIDEDFRNKKIHKVFLIHKEIRPLRSVKDIAKEIRETH